MSPPSTNQPCPFPHVLIISQQPQGRNLDVSCMQAQLGDSRLSPAVGQLVLGDLCPAVTAIIRDGLKPYQQDVITGHRRSAPWGVVVASVRPGPVRSSLYSLYCTVCQLPQLSNAQRFIAFIFGLLK
ncbi:RUN and SH3 domain-containing protein 1-like isoform X2 [Callorhinchus milii]|uniref:RUN and SH3 domain-containing protein 1-like isoform X2 n=1 Tax=Callorhinchus milii TaxID=7868 RepID=UPI00045734C9|nr:RUN and SH3 domain-containing protein 1-like isoform X2 [Callorhinchus milii]|eukprot:gi/632990530/ref/XP_007884208.1/ PREDICTED: RUN and SH3 domain-containing protein 1-like [Callorhinchus milii]